jgi:hypothetical protein
MHDPSLNGDGVPGRNLPFAKAEETKIIKDLSGRYQELESLWKQAEDDLRQFRVPETVAVNLDDDVERDFVLRGMPCDYYTLEWRKCGKNWRICHVMTIIVGDDILPDDGRVTPISDCPYDVRLRMIEHFPELRAKVVEAAQKAIEQLDGAIDNLHKMLYK